MAVIMVESGVGRRPQECSEGATAAGHGLHSTC